MFIVIQNTIPASAQFACEAGDADVLDIEHNNEDVTLRIWNHKLNDHASIRVNLKELRLALSMLECAKGSSEEEIKQYNDRMKVILK